MQVSTGCAPFSLPEIGLHYLSEQTVCTPLELNSASPDLCAI